MKPNQLSDKALLQQTLLLVKREKEILSEILLHLQEVQRRRLFCDIGYGSLFQYCVKQLGYSEDQTYRRINALKLVKEIPAVQEQIAKGELSLSTLGVAQSLFKADATVDKKEVLNALIHKSKREAEVIVKSFSPKIEVRKKELKLALSLTQEEKWNAVKAKLAHCNLTEEEILERLCDSFLSPKPVPKKTDQEKLGSNLARKPAPSPAPPRNSAAKNVSKPIQKEIFKKANNSCTNCGSSYALEVDHKIPRALGGTNHPSNLRILCRACNQRSAIRIFGNGKMSRYLEKKP